MRFLDFLELVVPVPASDRPEFHTGFQHTFRTTRRPSCHTVTVRVFHLPPTADSRRAHTITTMANDTGERQQYLRLLSFMDATFPASTKLPTHVLRERLVKALDLSQMLTELFGAKGPKLNTLKRWDRRKLLTHGMAHYSSEESSEWGMDNSNIDPFNEVRSTIPEAIAYGYDSGWTSLFYYFEKGGGRDIRVEVSFSYCCPAGSLTHFCSSSNERIE